MLTLLRTVVLVLVVGAVQSVLADAWSPLGAVDGLIIVVGLLALRLSYPAALLTAGFAGIVQDSLAGGLLGVHSFSKTVVAAVLNSMSSVLVVRGQLAEAIVIGVAAFADGLVARVLMVFLNWPLQEPISALGIRGIGTGIVCAAFLLLRPWVLMRWRRWRTRPRRLL
jgi:cell shape-determining protein MreD